MNLHVRVPALVTLATAALLAPGCGKVKDASGNGAENPAAGSAEYPASLPPPYLRRAGERDGIAIWIVDGSFVRTHIGEEFTNFGQHGGFAFIPDSEFWIDTERTPDEFSFFVDHLLVEHRLTAAGVPYDAALEAADSAERRARRDSGDVAKLTAGGALPDPARVHAGLWKHLAAGLDVWIVDGRLVRSVFDVDFTEGGHDHVYEFVPRGEIWIDNDVSDAERPYILLHELHERALMSRGWDYDRAHDSSSVLESRLRSHPEELHAALAREGWE